MVCPRTTFRWTVSADGLSAEKGGRLAGARRRLAAVSESPILWPVCDDRLGRSEHASSTHSTASGSMRQGASSPPEPARSAAQPGASSGAISGAGPEPATSHVGEVDGGTPGTSRPGVHPRGDRRAPAFRHPGSARAQHPPSGRLLAPRFVLLGLLVLLEAWAPDRHSEVREPAVGASPSPDADELERRLQERLIGSWRHGRAKRRPSLRPPQWSARHRPGSPSVSGSHARRTSSPPSSISRGCGETGSSRSGSTVPSGRNSWPACAAPGDPTLPEPAAAWEGGRDDEGLPSRDGEAASIPSSATGRRLPPDPRRPLSSPRARPCRTERAR